MTTVPAPEEGRADEALVARFPTMPVDPDTAAFYGGWLERRLLLNRCASCGHWHHPPVPRCPRCWSTDVVPTEVSGDGTVHLLIRLHQGPPASGVDYTAGPHPVVTVELAEQPGLRFTSTVVDCPPDELRIGLPVSLTWIERDGAPFPVFRRASERPPATTGGAAVTAGADDTPAPPTAAPASATPAPPTAAPASATPAPARRHRARNPLRDQVAIVGIGSTGFSRHGNRTPTSLTLEAATAAIADAGLTAADIDGVVSTGEPAAPSPQQVAAMLGLPEVTHYPRTTPVVMFGFIDAVNAVFSGSADTVLLYNSVLRLPWNSRSAAQDPFRRRFATGVSAHPESMSMAVAYTGWASRYLYEYGATRRDLGLVTVNARSNGTRNPLGALRDPITMDDYLQARMIREPFGMLDMDLPVDGADAFVVTTAERARDLDVPTVLVHAATTGTATCTAEDQLPDLRHHGQHVVARSLQAKSDRWIGDVDVFLPYDGFTIITLGWIENLGWCGPGEAGAFLRQHWDEDSNRVLIDGRIPINPHGGALAEGATRGSGYVREAVQQLRGQAGDRQVAGARTALVTSGGFFFNSQGLVLVAG